MRRTLIFLVMLASVALRLVKIDAPFDDRWSWRQSDVAAIARNYFENGFHFGRPQIDWAGDQPGYVGTEFPLLPFVAAIIYKVTGVHEWVGRTLTIAFFAISLPFFYLLVREFCGEVVAIFALVFYSFAPLMIAASRAFMPDLPSLVAALAALFFLKRSLEKTGRVIGADATLASVLLAISILLKPTTITIAAPMATLVWQQFRSRIILQPSLWLMLAIAVVPGAIWYWHACWIAHAFYPHHMFGAGGVKIMGARWYWRILRLTFLSNLTPVLFLLAVLGLFVSSGLWLFRWWLVAIILFVMIAGYGNRHDWYRLPLVPVAAVFAAVGLAWLKERGGSVIPVAALLLFVMYSAFSTVQAIVPASAALWQLGGKLREITPPNALIVVADDGDPTALYYGHRKGWHFLEHDGVFYGNPSDSAQLIDNVDSLRKRGAGYIAFSHSTKWWLDYYLGFTRYLDRTATPVALSNQYRIYRLN